MKMQSRFSETQAELSNLENLLNFSAKIKNLLSISQINFFISFWNSLNLY